MPENELMAKSKLPQAAITFLEIEPSFTIQIYGAEWAISANFKKILKFFCNRSGLARFNYMRILRPIHFSLVLLLLPLELQAQFRWHVVIPDRVDTLHFGFTSISCSGESCSAIGVAYGIVSSDSSFLLHSTDCGLTWVSVAIPRWYSDSDAKAETYFSQIQQIDSLNAIAVDEYGMVIQTFDGWKTWRTSASIPPTFSNGFPSWNSLYGSDFGTADQGMVNEGFGWYLSTLDSGNHWDVVKPKGEAAIRSYGAGTFRMFIPPATILTTYDDWKTWDTAYLNLTDSVESDSIWPQFLSFGGDDSIAVLLVTGDTPNYILGIAESSNLGKTWQFPLHDSAHIQPFVITSLSNRTIVVAGIDSAGEIAMSTDRGATWHDYKVPLDNGMPYYRISSVAVTGSGRVLAVIVSDSNYLGSNVLAYLETTSSIVTDAPHTENGLTLFPNPSTSVLTVDRKECAISILDPLGREYSVPKNGRTLDVSSLSSGIYFVTDGNGSAKFVKD